MVQTGTDSRTRSVEVDTMENGIWRFASAASRHPAEPGKYSALIGIWWIRDPGIGQNPIADWGSRR